MQKIWTSILSFHTPFSTPAPSRATSRAGSPTNSHDQEHDHDRSHPASPTRIPTTTNSRLNDNNEPNTHFPSGHRSNAKQDDWEYPLSPFSQQQTSTRPLPFREHGAPPAVTLKSPRLPASKSPAPESGTSPRSVRAKRAPRMPGGTGGGGGGGRLASPPQGKNVPEIRVAYLPGTASGGKVSASGTGGWKLVLRPIGEGDLGRYGLVSGVVLPKWVGGDEEKWRWIRDDMRVNGAKVEVGWSELEADMSAGAAAHEEKVFRDLKEYIKTAARYDIFVLVSLYHPAQSAPVASSRPRSPSPPPQFPPRPGSNKDARVLRRIYDSILGRYHNILGVELAPPHHVVSAGIGAVTAWYDEMTDVLAHLDGEVPVYIPVRKIGDVNMWIEYAKRWRKGGMNPVVLDVFISSGSGGDVDIPVHLDDKGVDYVVSVASMERIRGGIPSAVLRKAAGWFDRFERTSVDRNLSRPLRSSSPMLSSPSPPPDAQSYELRQAILARKKALRQTALERFLETTVSTSANKSSAVETTKSTGAMANSFWEGYGVGFMDALEFMTYGQGTEKRRGGGTPSENGRRVEGLGVEGVTGVEGEHENVIRRSDRRCERIGLVEAWVGKRGKGYRAAMEADEDRAREGTTAEDGPAEKIEGVVGAFEEGVRRGIWDVADAAGGKGMSVPCSV